MRMEIKLAYDYGEEIKKLFLEYANMLVENDPEFKKYLELQNYAFGYITFLTRSNTYLQKSGVLWNWII